MRQPKHGHGTDKVCRQHPQSLATIAMAWTKVWKQNHHNKPWWGNQSQMPFLWPKSVFKIFRSTRKGVHFNLHNMYKLPQPSNLFRLEGRHHMLVTMSIWWVYVLSPCQPPQQVHNFHETEVLQLFATWIGDQIWTIQGTLGGILSF